LCRKHTLRTKAIAVSLGIYYTTQCILMVKLMKKLLIIKSDIVKHYEIGKFQREFLQAASIMVKNQNGCTITISALYSPPKHTIKKKQYIGFFKTLGNRFIAARDCNAKHTNTGDRDWSYPKDVNYSKPSKQWTWQPTPQGNPPTGHPTIKRSLIYWTSASSKASLKNSAAPSVASNYLQILL